VTALLRRMSQRYRAFAQFGLLACTVAGTWLSFGDVLRQSDLHVFLRAGDQVIRGASPYDAPTDPHLWSGSAYVYPWLSAFLFAPLDLLPLSAAYLLFYVLGCAAIVLGVRLLGVRSVLAACALLLSAPVLRNAELGAVNALFFLAGAAVWRWRDRARVVVVGLLLLVGTKLFLAPLLLWVLLTRSRRCALATVAALTGFFVVGFGLGPISLGTYARSMSVLAEHEQLRGMSLHHLASLLLPLRLAGLVPPLVGGAVLVAAVAVYRRHPARHDLTLFVSCLSAGLLLTPILWTHYLVLVLLAVLLVRPTTGWAVGAAVGSWVLVSPAHLAPLGGLPVLERLLLLHTVLVVLPVVTAVRAHREGEAELRDVLAVSVVVGVRG
jgi:alpha-1,2-mannosyltransferase